MFAASCRPGPLAVLALLFLSAPALAAGEDRPVSPGITTQLQAAQAAETSAKSEHRADRNFTPTLRAAPLEDRFKSPGSDEPGVAKREDPAQTK